MNYMHLSNFKNIDLGNRGFTLIELLMAMAISGIVMAAVYNVYQKQQGHYLAQNQVTDMQQNLRSAANLLGSDLRKVAYDPSDSGNFGILGVKKDVSGNSIVLFSTDLNEDGILDLNETITFSLYDFLVDDDDIPDLGRDTGGGNQLVAESIEALGVAYAFDDDSDGHMDENSGGHVIWGVDSDNNNTLDKYLDTNFDGKIDSADTAGGVALGSAVGLNQIRAARVWALAKSKVPDPNFRSNTTYVVADRRIATGDKHRRRLLEFTIYFRNTGI